MEEKKVLQTLLDKQKKRVWVGAIILVIILGVVGICSTISGKADIQIAEVWQIIFAKLSGQTAALEEIKKSTKGRDGVSIKLDSDTIIIQYFYMLGGI